jgi:hypothetical protein
VKHVTHGKEEECIQGFGGKPCINRLLGRTKHRWEDTNKTDLTKQNGKMQNGFTWLQV